MKLDFHHFPTNIYSWNRVLEFPLFMIKNLDLQKMILLKGMMMTLNQMMRIRWLGFQWTSICKVLSCHVEVQNIKLNGREKRNFSVSNKEKKRCCGLWKKRLEMILFIFSTTDFKWRSCVRLKYKKRSSQIWFNHLEILDAGHDMVSGWSLEKAFTLKFLQLANKKARIYT
jgi:hypothetical protein